MNKKNVNVSHYLKDMARIQPYKRAVVVPYSRDRYSRVAYIHYTFEQLDKKSDYIAHGLERVGIKRGVRTILMVRPSLEFFALTFALFKIGAVPVVVDPGMGIHRMIRCFKESRPEGFIGIPAAHVLRCLYPRFFNTVKVWITVGRQWFWGGHNLKNISEMYKKPYKIAETRGDETAAILFTTGSTGPAKGVVYTHNTFDAQVKAIKSYFRITRDEIDLPTFPLFSLFDPALGMTAVIPDMDPTKPARANPEKIIETVIDQGITNMFASPALLNRVGSFGKKKGVKLPSLKRVVSAGAPVAPEIIRTFSSMLSDGAQIHAPYGATESMPVSSIGSDEILSETEELSKKGMGICVGRPVGNIEVRIIRITDEPVKTWSDDILVPDGQAGEIAVRGDVVTKGYFEREKDNLYAKITGKDGSLWHRMGDLGRIDSKGRIWLLGRKSHRVVLEDKTLYTVPCEAVFNRHPAVFRSALVGVFKGKKRIPVICIELRDGIKNRKTIIKELQDLAFQNNLTKDIKTILFHKRFPVDIRHNSKIFREKLTKWAAKKISL